MPSQLCLPQPSRLLPVGYGAIVGGVYIEGGPPPGGAECVMSPYTITATSTATGATAAMQSNPGGSGYILVVPAGSYALRTGVCEASASVTAAQTTHADTTCPGVPAPY